MKTISRANFNLARDFVMDRARPVDAAFFAYTFGNGKPDYVWDALSAFANPDGGFGHGMEPDCRLPASSAMATITAFPYLLQTGATSDHPLVSKGIRYLIDTYAWHLQGWKMLPPEVNDYPRASWWNYDPETADTEVIEHWSNPSACVVAYLHRYHDLVPDDFLDKVTAKAMSVISTPGMFKGHDYLPFIELAEAVPAMTGKPIWKLLKQQAHTAIVTDPAQWTGYGIRPLWAVTHPDSPLMPVLADAVTAHIDFEIDRQQPDGSWYPFWTWGRFEKEWKVAKTEWQGHLTVETLRSLKAFGRIGGRLCRPC